MAPVKRKRNERGSVDSGDNRPSPHRPGNTHLAQHERDGNMVRGGAGGGNRRSSRGGRGGPRGRNDRRSSSDFNPSPLQPQARGTSGPMSAPPPRPSSASQVQPIPQTQPATPSPAVIVASPPLEPRAEAVPYDYSHITDERIADWDTTGGREIIEIGKQALDDVDTLELSIIFQELIRAALDRRLSASEAGNCVKEILGSDKAAEQGTIDNCDGPALFLDSLSIVAELEPFDISLQKLVVASGVSPVIIRQVLDGLLLSHLGLTRGTFVRSGIRQVTNLLYRQSNHNLLREETEGYSKLVTELFTTSGSEPPTSEIVEETFEKVKGLIGTFDLDVGRVLDVTLDVFAAVLIKQFRFFIKFLRISSWWPRDSGLHGLSFGGYNGGGLPRWALPGSTSWAATAEDEEEAIPQREERDRIFWNRAREVGLDAFFELGGRHAIDTETKDAFLARKSEVDADIGPDRQWIEATGTAPPAGNRVAAQLLGFKLRFYASEAREEEDVLPANLIYLAALLIKIGFISLRDLYPHLWPLDEDMAAVKDAKMKELADKEKENRPGGGKNALMMAGALADDTIPNSSRTRDTGAPKTDSATTAPSASEAEERSKLPEPEDQKVKLLINLLTIGAIPESLFILGRFPWLPEAFPEILDLLHRILNYSVDKVYEASQVSQNPPPEITLKKIADVDQSSAAKGQVRQSEAVPRKPLRWPFPDKYDVHEAMVYRFYWDEWADNIPVCQNVDDIFTLCSTLLNYSGVNIGKDAVLLSKLYSIGSKSLADDHSEANLVRWRDLLKRLLVPALSLTKSNTNLSNELYEMLRYYPTPVRYNLYAEWFEGQTSRLPAMVAAFGRTRLETLSTMKRISKANLVSMAKTLNKIAYASPGVVFKVALSQIEAYSNLIEVVVECARYFTDLGYDVLIWSLLSSLGGKSRNRTRSDDVLLTSRWLIALSKFSGKVFKRYSNMNPAPVIQYINDQLYRGNATDLIVLEELIAQMAGIVSDTDFTDHQLLAMTGGEKLRRQTLINLQDKRFESEKTAKRLMRSLLDTKLAAPLLVSIAQHRQSAVFAVPDDEAHIKYLATLIDETQRILVQYLDLLRSNLPVDQFDAIVPNTAQLMAEFGLDPSLAFLIGRASFAHQVATSQTSTNGKDLLKTNGTEIETDIEGDVDMSAIESTEQSNPEDTPSPAASSDIWRESLTPLVAAVKAALPDANWDVMNPDFYVVFWQLSLSDIHLPMDSYSSENARLSRELADIMKDRTDMTRRGLEKKEEKRKTLEATKDELMKESKQQLMSYERVRARLNKDKPKWFANIDTKPEPLHEALLQLCFLPRLLLSPSDADYCFKMIKFLHNNGTPNFRTLLVYSRIFKANRLRALIFSSTIREAENLGRFLKQILGDLSRWHASKTLFEKEAIGTNHDLPGFAKKIGKDQKPEAFLDHEEFRRWVFNSHKALNTALKSCLDGQEWMHIRNAITVLKAVVDHFPAVNFMGSIFQRTLKEIGKREENVRDDLSLSANAVLPDLKKREGKWVMPQAFATNLGDSNSQMIDEANNNQTTNLQPGNVSKTVLQPTAPEFMPGNRITSNGSAAPKLSTGHEVEDGEVDDAKIGAALQAEKDKRSSGAPTSNLAQASISTSLQNASPTPMGRESTPKGPSTTLLSSGSAPRLDLSRNPSGTVLDKSHPGLPSRPDVPFPGRERHPSGRLSDRRDRPSDIIRDRPREPLGPERRISELMGREPRGYVDRNAAPERDRDRDRQDQLRRGPESVRDSRDGRGGRDRDRLAGDLQGLPDMNGRPHRADPMPPPRQSVVQPDRGPSMNAERAALVSPNDVPINPARAALIHGDSESSRLSRDNSRERPTSRPHSPRRSDRFGEPSDGRRGDRSVSGRHAGPELHDHGRGRHDDLPPFAAPPRSDRPGNRGTERPRDHSAFQPTQPLPRTLDPDHGRLNDASYGRLEEPAPEIPSGPRSSTRDTRDSRGGRGRQNNAPQPRDEPRPAPQESPRAPTPEKLPPTGPASVRAQPRRSGSGHVDTSNSSARTVPPPPPPPTPAAVGVHPSRIGIIEGAVNTPEPGLHPDRLRALRDQDLGRPPPPVQTNVRLETSMSSPMSGLAPSGPRGHQSPVSGSTGPSGFNAPTGPSSNDRNNRPSRERQGHQIAGIQSTLLQAGQQMVPDRQDTRIRGRGGRNGNGLDSHPSSTPSTPMPGPPVTPINPVDIRASEVDRAQESINPQRKELLAGRGANSLDGEFVRQDSRSATRGRDPLSGVDRPHRSGRHSHRTSRSRSPDRDRERDRLREREVLGGEPPREHRRGGDRDRRQPGEPTRERDIGRRDGRDGEKGRVIPPRIPNEPGWGGESGNGNGNGPERGGRRSDIRQPGGSGDGRRDSRSSRDADGGSGRKRRDDEGGAMGVDRPHNKRPRR